MQRNQRSDVKSKQYPPLAFARFNHSRTGSRPVPDLQKTSGIGFSGSIIDADMYQKRYFTAMDGLARFSDRRGNSVARCHKTFMERCNTGSPRFAP